MLSWTKIPAIIHDDNEKAARLWHIAENLHRNELTVLERSEYTAEWIKEVGIEEQVVPQSGPGRPEGAVAKAARTLPLQGKSQEACEKTARRALRIDKISQAAKDALRQAGLDDNQSALLKVARVAGPDAQLRKATELAGRGQQSTHDASVVNGALSGLATLIASARKFDLALLTPNSEHVALAGKEYADPETLQNSLPLHAVLRDKAVILSVARLTDAPVIASFMRRAGGFTAAKRPRILLLQRPVSPDVSDAKVIIAMERGRPRFKPPSGDLWSDPEPDPLTLAKRLCPDCVDLVHVFAEGDSAGWTSLVGSNSWVEKPSI